jgi:hypothetical protein
MRALSFFSRLKADGEIFSTCPQRSRRGTILACGAVSADCPRSLHRIESGHLNTENYLAVMDSVISPGRTIFASNNSAHRSMVATQFFSSRRASSILWPPKSLDIMPMTSIWNKFVMDLNHSTSIVSNTVQLWGEMEDVWADFIFNNDFIDPTTVGYVWVDLGRIVDDIG